MNEIGAASIIALAGMGVGIGSVFLSMWFLPTLLKQFGMVTVITPASYNRALPEYLPLKSEPMTGIQPILDATAEPRVVIVPPAETQTNAEAELRAETLSTKEPVANPYPIRQSEEQPVSELQNSPWRIKGNKVEYAETISTKPLVTQQTKMDIRAGSSSVKEQDINEELLAVIVATLSDYRLNQNESYQIKQVRQVN